MLEQKEIKALVENPKRKNDLNEGRKHEQRLRFHSQTTLENDTNREARQDFLNWVHSLLPEDKYQIFLSLFKYPLPTVPLTQEAFSALEKVFDGRDADDTFEFQVPEHEADWEQYREQKLNEPWVWREEAFEVFRTAINSFVVVDLPEEQQGPLPEPYFYFLSLDAVIDFGGEADKLDYIIFKQPDNRIAVIDDTSYRVFQSDEGHREVKELLLETKHDLGYCPARAFWSTPISRDFPFVKRSPITNHLADLDWYLFFSISKKHLDLYAPYPIYSGYESSCDYEKTDGEVQEYCDRGFLRDQNGVHIFRGGHVAECPVCSKKRLAGVGSFVEVPPPGPENGNADLRNPVQITAVDRSSLDWNTEELERLERKFFEKVTGYGGDPLNSQAVNEKQVKAFFEGRTATLRSLKKDFETVMQWTDETICRLRYGLSFASANVDLGSEFYLLAADDLLDIYLLAQEKGADALTLDVLQTQYYETRFRNNPSALKRTMLLLEVEPLRHIGRDKALELYDKKIIQYPDLLLKINFSSLIMRFERENTVVTKFAVGKLDSQVDKIKEALYAYIAEMTTEAPEKPVEKTLPPGQGEEPEEEDEGVEEPESDDIKQPVKQ